MVIKGKAGIFSQPFLLRKNLLNNQRILSIYVPLPSSSISIKWWGEGDFMDSKHFMMFSELFEQFRLQALMLLREAEEAGFLDELTNCYNRKAYAIRKADLLESSVAVLFCDINGLKAVNDTKGHKAGDVLIRDLAKMLKAYFGGNNVFRVGGDEFVILRANDKPETFHAIVEEFKSAMEMHTTSVSIGCAMSSPEKSLDTAIIEAENEMYEQKKYFHKLEK